MDKLKLFLIKCKTAVIKAAKFLKTYFLSLFAQIKVFAKSKNKKELLSGFINYIPVAVCILLIILLVAFMGTRKIEQSGSETVEVISSYTDANGRVYTTVEIMFNGTTAHKTYRTLKNQNGAVAEQTAAGKTTAKGAKATNGVTVGVATQNKTSAANFTVKVKDKNGKEVILEINGKSYSESGIIELLYSKLGTQSAPNKPNEFVIKNTVEISGITYYYGEFRVIDLAASAKATTATTTKVDENGPDTTVANGKLKYSFFVSANGKYMFKGSYDFKKATADIDYSKNLFN